jgi:hypothetical protein
MTSRPGLDTEEQNELFGNDSSSKFVVVKLEMLRLPLSEILPVYSSRTLVRLFIRLQ